MSGFLKRAVAGDDPVDPDEALEEQYMRMYAKIGRDFVHKDDLKKIIQNLILAIDPKALPLIFATSDSEARQRAREYKAMLDENKLGSDVYKDLIDLND